MRKLFRGRIQLSVNNINLSTDCTFRYKFNAITYRYNSLHPRQQCNRLHTQHLKCICNFGKNSSYYCRHNICICPSANLINRRKLYFYYSASSLHTIMAIYYKLVLLKQAICQLSTGGGVEEWMNIHLHQSHHNISQHTTLSIIVGI